MSAGARTGAGLGRTALLALPALLLAAGWALASVREARIARSRHHELLRSAANAVAAAAREGLEELRAREDERPYYHYAYYFTPPDLIATQESVAVSPLGTVQRDARVLGHFQLDPGARASTPLEHPEAPLRSRQRADAVLSLARGPALAARLGALANEAPAANARAVGPQAPQYAALVNTNSVVQQRAYSDEVLADIRAAQSGERGAVARNLTRGRAPARPRVDVPWGSVLDRVSSRRASSSSLSGSGSDGDENNEGRAGPTRDLETRGEENSRGPAPARRDEGDAALYTPMVFAREGAGLRYLYRVVTTAGQASVQGVLLASDELTQRWLGAVLRRHQTSGVRLSLRAAHEAGACGALAPLPLPLDDLAVCAEGTQAPSAVPWLQLGAIAFALALVAAAGAARLRALRRAERLAVTERAFVASVSHELRTPLTTLRMHAEMLHEGWVSEERKPRVLQQLVDESTRLARLIEDVLTFGRLADGRAQLDLRPGALAARVRAVVEREAPRLRERGVAVTMPQPPEGDDDPALRAVYDDAALEQVLVNLLENAARYASAPAGEAPRPVEVSVQATPRGVALRVRDHGPGLDARDRERVFERFVRTEAAVRSHVAGTGLGLAIVRGLARAWGGDAELSAPDEGPGLVATVRVPAAPSMN